MFAISSELKIQPEILRPRNLTKYIPEIPIQEYRNIVQKSSFSEYLKYVNNSATYKEATTTKNTLNKIEGSGDCINCSLICLCFKVV